MTGSSALRRARRARPTILGLLAANFGYFMELARFVLKVSVVDEARGDK